MTTQWREWRPLEEDVDVDGGGDRKGGGQPVITVTNIFPPYDTPLHHFMSFSPGLSTADVATAVVILGDCGQQMTGLQ
jgi:hypothetical protein